MKNRINTNLSEKSAVELSSSVDADLPSVGQLAAICGLQKTMFDDVVSDLVKLQGIVPEQFEPALEAILIKTFKFQKALREKFQSEFAFCEEFVNRNFPGSAAMVQEESSVGVAIQHPVSASPVLKQMPFLTLKQLSLN